MLWPLGCDRGLSKDSIQEELEDEPLQFKGPMTRTRSKRLKDQNYSRLLMLQAILKFKEYEDHGLKHI